MYMYPTSADVYRICRIAYMYMCRAAVHNLDAEFTFLKWRSRIPFFLVSSRFCIIFLLMYLTRLPLSALVASCVFGYSLEPDQTDNLNFVTI